jgi:hypothetical protein
MIYLSAIFMSACSNNKTGNNSAATKKQPVELHQFLIAENNLTPGSICMKKKITNGKLAAAMKLLQGLNAQ